MAVDAIIRSSRTLPLVTAFLSLTILFTGRTCADPIVGSHFVEEAAACEAAGDLDRAVRYMRRAVEYGDCSRRRKFLAELLEKQGRLRAALGELRKAAALEPSLELERQARRLVHLIRVRERKLREAEEERREREIARRQEELRRRAMQASSIGHGRAEPAGEGYGASTGPASGPTGSGAGGSGGAVRGRAGADTAAVAAAVDANTAVFVDGLRSSSALVRRKSAQALAAAGRRDLAGKVAALLGDEDENVRFDAADALVSLAGPSVVESLGAALKREKSPMVRARLADALAAVGSPGAMKILNDFRRSGGGSP